MAFCKGWTGRSDGGSGPEAPTAAVARGRPPSSDTRSASSWPTLRRSTPRPSTATGQRRSCRFSPTIWEPTFFPRRRSGRQPEPPWANLPRSQGAFPQARGRSGPEGCRSPDHGTGQHAAHHGETLGDAPAPDLAARADTLSALRVGCGAVFVPMHSEPRRSQQWIWESEGVALSSPPAVGASAALFPGLWRVGLQQLWDCDDLVGPPRVEPDPLWDRRNAF